MSLNILLNGQPKSIEASTDPTLLQFVLNLGLQADRVAVEINGAIVRRNLWSETRLADGDRVELVQFVGGGVPVS